MECSNQITKYVNHTEVNMNFLILKLDCYLYLMIIPHKKIIKFQNLKYIFLHFCESCRDYPYLTHHYYTEQGQLMTQWLVYTQRQTFFFLRLFFADDSFAKDHCKISKCVPFSPFFTTSQLQLLCKGEAYKKLVLFVKFLM